MAEKTIRIAPIADNFDQENIRKALGDFKINRIHLGKNFAYVELDNEQDIQILEFKSPDNRLDELDGAEFKRVEASFKWGSISSQSSSIQQLKDQPQHFQKIQINPVSLAEPNPQSLITISNCDVTIINQLTENQIKNNIFGQFQTINRILKKGNRVIIQLLDPVQAQKFQQVFPNLQIPALGKGANVDLQAQNEPNFALQWVDQHHKQEGVKYEKPQQNQQVLHQEILPKIHKLTSMQDDWIKNQKKGQGSQTKVQSRYFDITQNSQQGIKTKEQLPGSFILETQTNRQQILIGGADQQQSQKRLKQQKQNFQKLKEMNRLRQQEQKRKVQQQMLRLQQQRKLKEKQLYEKEQRQRQQIQQREKEQRQRKQRQQRERQRAEREQRQKEQREKQQREQREREQQQRQKEKEQRQRKERQQREREQREREQREREQRERQQRQKEQKQTEQRLKRESQQRQKERIQKQAHDRQLAEKQRLSRLEAERNAEKLRLLAGQEKQRQQKRLLEQGLRIQRERQQLQRKRRQAAAELKRLQQQNARKSAQQRLREGIEKAKQGIDNFIINTNGGKIQSQLASESQTPILFWSLVMVALFILLI